MSRTTMFTREIAYSIATAMVCRVKEAKVETVEVKIPFETDDNSRALAYLQKYEQDGENVYVSVSELKSVKKLYGCTLEQFLTVAQELDENRKPIKD